MLSSLLIKMAMLGLTMGVVLWVGWTVPQARFADPTSKLGQQENPIRSSGPLAVSEAAFGPLMAQPQEPAQMAKRPIAEKVDLNRATEKDFEALPGIGPVLAERIVEYRQSRGAFREVDQLRHVKGIGKKKFERIRSLVGVTPPAVPPSRSKRAT